jgi:hypothetical protein
MSKIGSAITNDKSESIIADGFLNIAPIFSEVSTTVPSSKATAVQQSDDIKELLAELKVLNCLSGIGEFTDRDLKNRITKSDLAIDRPSHLKPVHDYLKVHFDELAKTGPDKDAIYIKEKDGSPDEKMLQVISGGNEELKNALRQYTKHGRPRGIRLDREWLKGHKAKLAMEKQTADGLAKERDIDIILKHFDTASANSQPDRSKGISTDDLKEAQRAAFDHLLVASVKAGGPPAFSDGVERAIQLTISKVVGEDNHGGGIPDGKPLERRLNNLLRNSPYKFDITYAKKSGAHGSTALAYAIKIVDNSGRVVAVAESTFDTVRQNASATS